MKLKLCFTSIQDVAFPTIISQFILAFRTCRTLPLLLSENLHGQGQVIVKTLIDYFLFSISSVQEHCSPRMLVRKNPFTNRRCHGMSNTWSGERGRSELVFLAETSGKMQKVTSAQILGYDYLETSVLQQKFKPRESTSNVRKNSKYSMTYLPGCQNCKSDQ